MSACPTSYLPQRFGQRHTMPRLVVLGIAAVLSHAAVAAPSLSDREASALAGKLFSNFEHFPVPIGTFSVVREGANAAAGRLGPRDDALVRAANKVGIVAVKGDRAFESHTQGGKFSWDAFYQQSQQGVAAKYTVSATSQGEAQCRPSTTDRGWLECPRAKFSDVKIVENQEKRAGVSEYRYVLVKYRAEWTQLAKAVHEILGQSSDNDLKGALLFKWDPFEKQWTVAAQSYARGAAALDTSAIDRVLQAAK